MTEADLLERMDEWKEQAEVHDKWARAEGWFDVTSAKVKQGKSGAKSFTRMRDGIQSRTVFVLSLMARGVTTSTEIRRALNLGPGTTVFTALVRRGLADRLDLGLYAITDKGREVLAKAVRNG